MTQFCHLKYFPQILYLCWTLGSVVSQGPKIEGTVDVGSSYFFYQRPDYPRDCTEAIQHCSTSNLSGVHLIKPDGYPEPFEVYCDHAIDLGEYTVLYRFQGDSLLFNRNWTEYKSGFGFLSQEFWIGLDKLSFLTNQKSYELRIDVTGINGLPFYVKYNRFRISDEFSEYKLTSVGEYSGSEANISAFLCPSSSEDEVYISQDCSRRCSCTRGLFKCGDYQCSPNAVCEDRNNGQQCYCNSGYKGDGVNCTLDVQPSDCQDVYDRVSNESGVYRIKPSMWSGEPFEVYCNMTEGGGWTVFQRRVDGSLNFNLYWSDYQEGFGTLDHEFWLGNDKLNNLTAQKSYELRVDFVNSNNALYYAKYSSFTISDGSDNYRLSIGSYSGNAGNSLNYHNGHAFSTRDRDNDNWGGRSCVNDVRTVEYCEELGCNFRGAWWFADCADSSLNSPYGTNCFYWANLPGSHCRMRYVEMKIRPV